MLNIFYGEMKESALYGPSWFKYSYDPNWFNDELVQAMMQDIDKSKYVAGHIIESSILGPIPPEKLSGGLQTLIMIYEMPDKIFDATSCGPNCNKWLLEIGKRKDVTVNLQYYMTFEGLEPLDIKVLNTDKVVNSEDELVMEALDFLEG